MKRYYAYALMQWNTVEQDVLNSKSLLILFFICVYFSYMCVLCDWMTESGKYRWTLNVIRDFYSISGEMEFNLEYITASVKVGQPANLDELVKIDELDLEIGNIAVLSDGTGTLDYAIEAFINIVPNLLRKPIIDALEDPIREMIQDEVRKALHIEAEIEKRLPPSGSSTDTEE